MEFVVALALVLIAGVSWHAWQVRARGRQRQRTIRGVLDAADALEARLRAARDELEPVAGSHEDPVRGALQDILRQRLWLQEHALTAEVTQLDAVRRTLDDASERLDRQLLRVSQARAGR